MGHIFSHVTRSDRITIEAMLKAGSSRKEIAEKIGVHISTIYREEKRGRYIHTNSDLTEEERYSPDIADEKYRENLKARVHRRQDRERGLQPRSCPRRD